MSFWIEADAANCKSYRRGPFDTDAQARDAKREHDAANPVEHCRVVTVDGESPTWREDES